MNKRGAGWPVHLRPCAAFCFPRSPAGVASLVHGTLASVSPTLPLAVGVCALVLEGIVFLRSNPPPAVGYPTKAKGE